jgi:DNA-binding beta-propeller fold protein YncE
VKFTKDGKFIKTWGRLGSEPGNFREPHDLYVGGPKGYVYVADRQNNRVQVFDQDGTFIAAWKQFGQPSSVYVDEHDNIYVGATYENIAPGQTVLRRTPGVNDRAIVIRDAITGALKCLIPDPTSVSTTSGSTRACQRSDYLEAVPKAASSTVNDQSRFADSTRMWKTRGSSAA